MVAHLHVTLGRLSNDRPARMLSLSGAREEVIMLGRHLRCQICAMVRRPPTAAPQVADSKPKQFNELLCGDSFYIWGSNGKKYAVTHFIDGLTDYHVGDLTDRPDSSFSREGPELYGTVHEIVPEGAKWRVGQAERHGAIVKLMMMRTIRAMDLRGLSQMRLAALGAFSAKNRLCSKGGVSPLQAVTGRNSVLPSSLMQQITGGHVRFKYNQALGSHEALAQAERIRRGRVKAFPLEKLRLATADEMMGSQFITKALADVEASLQDGTVTVEGQEANEPNEAAPAAETAPKSKAKRVRKLSVSSSSDYADGDTPMDPEAEARAKRLDDTPFSVRQHMLRKAEEATLPTDPHELDFLKKRRMFGQLAKQLEPPYTLQEAGIRDRSS
eukprot:s5458_g3.t1